MLTSDSRQQRASVGMAWALSQARAEYPHGAHKHTFIDAKCEGCLRKADMGSGTYPVSISIFRSPAVGYSQAGLEYKRIANRGQWLSQYSVERP